MRGRRRGGAACTTKAQRVEREERADHLRQMVTTRDLLISIHVPQGHIYWSTVSLVTSFFPQLVLPSLNCLLRCLHCQTAIKVTICPTTTRVGNTLPGGLSGIRPGTEWGLAGSRDSWESPGERWGCVEEGGASQGCGAAVLDFKPKRKPTCLQLTREQSERAPLPPFFLLLTQTAGKSGRAPTHSLLLVPSLPSFHNLFSYVHSDLHDFASLLSQVHLSLLIVALK